MTFASDRAVNAGIVSSGFLVAAALAALFNPSDRDVISGDRGVQRVLDGDSLALGTGEPVRLIGVATPETQHPNRPVEYFGKERRRSHGQQ
jgi:micrococcal nuclease